MVSRIPSQDEARARRGPMEGPQRVNNEALAEEDAASTTDPIELFRPSRNDSVGRKGMASRILSQDEARARRGPMEGP